MKINLILIFTVLIISFLSCSKESKKINDWQRMNLKGRIQQIDESKYPSYQALQLKQAPQKSFTRFTVNGLINKSGIYMGEKDILWMKYDYRGDSVWIEETRELNSKNEYPQAYWLYKVDPYGAQTSITSILIDSSINFHIDMDINENGNATEIRYSQQKYPTHVPCKITKVYNDDGSIKEEFTYRYNQILEKCNEEANHSVFTINEQGHVEREKMTTYDGRKRVYSYQYKYDDQGNWTQRIHYTGDEAGEVIIRNLTYYKDE